MRLRVPHTGFSLAWGGDLGNMGAEPTRRRRDLNAALRAEAGTAPVAATAGWAPTTPDLLQRVREGLSRHLDRNQPVGDDLPQVASEGASE